MATRRNKNGQFTKRTTRRRRASPSSAPRRSRGKAPTSVLKVAETAMVANAVTQGMFNVDLKTFFMGGKTAEGINTTGGKMITGMELISGLTGGNAGTSGSMKFGNQYRAFGDTLAGQLKTNLKDNGVNMMVQVVGIPLAFKYGKKILAKPVINPVNRLIRNGLGVKELKV